jgi:Raf kinase inhibitor-like YbhB/YbcL family protein
MVRASQFLSLMMAVVAGLWTVGYAQGSHFQRTHQKRSSSRKETSMFQLKSSAFQDQGNIPPRFTCEGENISPELTWNGAPQGTKSFALIVHDPDAPRAGGYTHWVVYNVPGSATHIAENAPKQDKLPDGGIQGKNDGGSVGYTGPCPPSGTHRYYFRLYALGTELNLKGTADKAALEKALKGHVLGEAEFMGKYTRGASKAA